VLSTSSIETLHTATLEILDTTGVRVGSPEALELLDDAGASVESDNWVRIPRRLVTSAIETAPSNVLVYDRDGEPSMLLENHESYFGTVADCTDYLDPRTGKRRPCSLADTADMCLVTDALPNFSFIHQAGLAADVDPDFADRAVFHEMVRNTRKSLLVGCSDGAALAHILEVSAIVAGGREALRERPFVCYFGEPISPLIHPRESLEKLLVAAEWGVPAVYIPMPEAGSTAPASLAGVVVQANAETLSGLVVHQLKQPGGPFIYGGIPGMMDMQSTVVSYGAPEMNLMVAAMTDLAHHYHLPMFGTAGCTDAKVIDGQAATEAALSCLVSALNGANLVHDCSYMDHASMISPAYAVLINEILEWVGHFSAGIRTDDEDLALDVIKEAGPTGEYITTAHTLNNFRSFWYPKLFDRSVTGADVTGFAARLREEAVALIEDHKPASLPTEVERNLDRLKGDWETPEN
jgi:trimethylamine--corrinoid protein Co-methyltransferase